MATIVFKLGDTKSPCTKDIATYSKTYNALVVVFVIVILGR